MVTYSLVPPKIPISDLTLKHIEDGFLIRRAFGFRNPRPRCVRDGTPYDSMTSEEQQQSKEYWEREIDFAFYVEHVHFHPSTMRLRVLGYASIEARKNNAEQ